MRRKDREITDSLRIADIINRCTCCRIGFYDDGEIYVVPLNFGYEVKDDSYVFYFHGAKEGRKIDLTKRTLRLALRWIRIMFLRRRILPAIVRLSFKVSLVMAL